MSEKQTPSLPTADESFVLMSEELKDRVDTAQFGDDIAQTFMTPPGATRAPVMTSVFVCGVTLSDEEERLGEVVSFEKGHTKHSVTFFAPGRVMDDIASAIDILRVRLFTSLETEVFDVEFDTDDPADQPELNYTLTETGHFMTLAFEVEDDTYQQENSPDDES